MQVIDDETRRFGRLLHYAGVLATVVCAAAGYSLLHAPTVHAVVDRSARINELKLSLRNGPVVRDQHRKVSEQLGKVTKRIADVQRRVPQEADAGEFLKELTQLASAEQLAIKDFNPEQSQIKHGYAEMEVTLNGAGSFASICSFVDRLAKLNRLSKVKNLTLSAVDIGDEYPMTATLVIYFGLQRKEMTSAQEGRRG
ncbi:MAG: type 4a pilus biogenesis protein PilO [Pirellulales bacterium]